MRALLRTILSTLRKRDHVAPPSRPRTGFPHRGAILIALTLLPALSRAADAPAPKRPNILFVLIDDMGYQDFSCFGSPRIQTPQVDRLAHEGLRFTQFYVSAPICSPSRVALSTGQYPLRWGITSYLDNRAANARRGINNWLRPDAPVISRQLHDAGYYTAHVGKWHMGGQRDVGDAPHIETYGFDRALTTFEGLCNERILPTFEPYSPADPYRYPQVRTAASLPGPFKNLERHKVTQALVDRAIDEMTVAGKQNKPFYVNLWLDDVHSPCQAPPMLRGNGSPEANYIGVMTEMDKQLGRLFDHVRSDPTLRDNTVIWVCSDNGPEKGLGSAGDLRGSKGQLYEGGIREPLIIWAPTRMEKSAVGTSNDKSLIVGVDFKPSILSIVGLPLPDGMDGVDRSPVLLGHDQSDRPQPAMWVRPPDRPGPGGSFPDLAIRDGKWKLLTWRDGKKTQLFDVRADPDETNDLSKDNPDLTKRLRDEVINWEKGIHPVRLDPAG